MLDVRTHLGDRLSRGHVLKLAKAIDKDETLLGWAVLRLIPMEIEPIEEERRTLRVWCIGWHPVTLGIALGYIRGTHWVKMGEIGGPSGYIQESIKWGGTTLWGRAGWHNLHLCVARVQKDVGKAGSPHPFIHTCIEQLFPITWFMAPGLHW